MENWSIICATSVTCWFFVIMFFCLRQNFDSQSYFYQLSCSPLRIFGIRKICKNKTGATWHIQDMNFMTNSKTVALEKFSQSCGRALLMVKISYQEFCR
mmetsp:Transcript_70759/g.123910  ORF Transcript_70759/g.123910 Transcript_70759/m.123910 type:complete len:99 (-) Transcript_70759:464-760(-)